MHTSTLGAMPVETMVSPLANSSAEYAPTKCQLLIATQSVTNKQSARSAVNQGGDTCPVNHGLHHQLTRGPLLQCLGLVSPQHQPLERFQSSVQTPLGSLP